MVTKTKTTKLKLPSLVVLKRALVARIEAEAGVPGVDLLEVAKALNLKSTDAVRKAASRALELYAGKECWFCATPHPWSVKAADKSGWAAVPLCKCLNDLRQGVVWHHPAGGVEQLLHIRTGVRSGALAANTPVVSRSCDAALTGKLCGRRFTLTAGMYKSALDSTVGQAAARDARKGISRTELERLGDFRHPTKCQACRDYLRERAATVRRPAPTFAQMVLEEGLLEELRHGN